MLNISFSGASLLPCLEPAREEPLSLLGVLRPLLVPGRLLLPTLLGGGKGGKAQSRLEESSGLGGRGSKIRGAGLVMVRKGGGLLPPMLLADRTLMAGDMGDSDRGGRGARKGRLAASGLIRGGAGRIGFGAGNEFEGSVGARTRV